VKDKTTTSPRQAGDGERTRKRMGAGHGFREDNDKRKDRRKEMTKEKTER
jgi:hypothetical protein